MRTLFLVVATLALCLALPARRPHSNLKIYGGKAAAPGQFPFVVSINLTAYQEEWCAGSIINENWILTTATCTALDDLKADELVVISGTNQPGANNGVLSNISQIVIHPNFTIDTFDQNNIALFKVDGSLVFSDLIAPVTLGEVAPGAAATVAGWGYTATEDSPALQYLEVAIWANDNCTAVAAGSTIGDDEVCAYGGEGTGLCGGDIAAALTHNGTLVGIGSWGINPCGGGAPDVYTRVSAFTDWISEVTAN